MALAGVHTTSRAQAASTYAVVISGSPLSHFLSASLGFWPLFKSTRCVPRSAASTRAILVFHGKEVASSNAEVYAQKLLALSRLNSLGGARICDNLIDRCTILNVYKEICYAVLRTRGLLTKSSTSNLKKNATLVYT